MRSRRHDFARRQVSYKEEWYDLYEDWSLIESSFSSQYGIRLRSDLDMSWSEFSALLSGIMPETPLGQIVGIRCEDDKDILKNFTKEQHKIRNDWKNRMAKQVVIIDEKEAARQVAKFQEMMKNAFS